MSIFRVLAAAVFVLPLIAGNYCAVAEDDDSGDTGGSSVLTGALMGGLLGGGVGAAIGSASGNAGKGALIGAGVGAVGGGLLGANEDSKRARTRGEAEPVEEPPKDVKAKKRVVKEYDDQGNVISEKEINT
jgi:outer membrane lipoprotein SlyB